MNDTAQRGTKRKRYEPPPLDLVAKIGGKLHHGLKEVKKVAKKVKAFERQRLIKKLRDLRKDEKADEVVETETLLELLKAVDHEMIATTAFKTKVYKDRILHSNPHVQKAMSEEVATVLIPTNMETPIAKVQSRLLSSKILAAEIITVVESLKNILQPNSISIANDGVEGQDIGVERPKKSKRAEQSKADKGDLPTPFKGGKEQEDEDRRIGKEGADLVEWGSRAVSDDEAETDGGWQSGSIMEDDEEDPAAEPNSYVEKLGLSSPKVSKQAPPTIVTSTKVSAKISRPQSTFLPSLTVGFVRGGSDDSDFSESEAKVADIGIKKNRRGQRARRAIWEKKYGRNANHKKKELENRQGASGLRAEHGPDTNHRQRTSSRPSIEKGPRRKVIRGPSAQLLHQKVDAGWAQRGASAQRPNGGHRVSEQPLHPSWEAKRKLREKERASIVPSQGKKIKFS